MITLYHGTNIFFNEIRLDECSPFKDFGKGFYLTPDLNQAMGMAKRRTRLSQQGTPTVLKYNFDESLLSDKSINVLTFPCPNREWAEFILKNRYESKAESHNYDIVIGPIANDGVAFQLERYVQGIISLDQLVNELTYRKLDTQYYFGTPKAIEKLKQRYD